MTASTVTPQDALQRCVTAMKLIDFADCKDETLWQSLAAAQHVAEGVLRDGVPEAEYTVAHTELAHKIITFFGRATSPSMEPGADPFADRLAEKLASWIGDLSAVPVAAQPVGAAPEGWVLAGYANGDELDSMLDDRAAVIYPKRTGFHATEVYKKEK